MNPVCCTDARWLKILQNTIKGAPKKVLFSAKIRGSLSPKLAQKGLTLLFNYLMYYKHILSILFYFWGSFNHQTVCFLFLHLNLHKSRIFLDLGRIGQENLVIPGNSDIILRILVKTHEIFNQRRFGALSSI